MHISVKDKIFLVYVSSNYWLEDVCMLQCLLYVDAAWNVGNVDMLISWNWICIEIATSVPLQGKYNEKLKGEILEITNYQMRAATITTRQYQIINLKNFRSMLAIYFHWY